MTDSAECKLLAMDESQFYRLLEEDGTVQIDIDRFGRYFVPFVSFATNDNAPRIRYGAIVRNRTDLLAAESVDDLLVWLHDIAGQFTRLKINRPDMSR